MNTALYNRILLLAVVGLLTTVLLLVWLRPVRTVTVSDQTVTGRLAVLQHQYDSLQREKLTYQVLADSLEAFKNQLALQLGQEQQFSLKLARQYLQTLQKNAALFRYDTLSAPDIARYLADSVR